MNTDHRRHAQSPPDHGDPSRIHRSRLPVLHPTVTDADALDLTARGRRERANALALAVTHARHVISSMAIDELRQLSAAIANDSFDQFSTIRKTIATAPRHDLIASFERLADAWEASHVARFAIQPDGA